LHKYVSRGIKDRPRNLFVINAYGLAGRVLE